MLRITQQDSSQGAKRYYASADYYSEGQEIVGRWGGLGACKLGLEGNVDKQSFDRLCDNLRPADGKQLTVRTRSDRTVGYDFTFSVPKSMSLLYAMNDDQELLEAFRTSVAETMCDIETEMKTRVRKNGKDEDRVTGNLVWAEFIHTTSRPVDGIPDPQLHAHAFVFNTTWDNEEHRWKAGQFRDLKRDAPYFQAAFRVRLANKLQDLGYAVERKRDDFEISGIPSSAIKKFSRRTELIEKKAAERGITDPDRKAELGALTREAKDSTLDTATLRQAWQDRLTEMERQAIAESHRREVPWARPCGGEKGAVNHALEHCFVRESVVEERKLLTEALKRGLGQVEVAKVQQELAQRPLIRGVQNGRAMATTSDVLAEESRLLAFARKGRGRFRPLGNPERPIVRKWLNAGQQNAVRHVLGSRDRVSILRGGAGTGKTTLEAELRDALEEAGRNVVALAQSAEASRDVLRNEAGFADADTVARFFVDERFQETARNGVILVDEASLVGMRDMLRLFDAAEKLDARVILVGDRRQHRAVAAGEPLKLLEERSGLPVAEVTEILRQSGDYRKATQAIAAGDIRTGFAELDRLGWIREVAGSERYRQLADAYLHTISEKKRNGESKTALIVSPTHAEAAQCTQAVRDSLKADHKLGAERSYTVWLPEHWTEAQKRDAAAYESGHMLQFHRNAPGHASGSRVSIAENLRPPVEYAGRFEVYRPATIAVAKGDRIRITANSRTKDGKHGLSNGAFYQVQGFTKQGDLILNNGWHIGKDDGHWTLGYAVTSHASQGKTVDKVFIGMSSQSFPATTQRTAYVAITRGREQAVVFTDQKQELLRAFERPDEPISATEFARGKQRKLPVRHRLARHLSFLRRLAYFQPLQETGRSIAAPAKANSMEHSYGR